MTNSNYKNFLLKISSVWVDFQIEERINYIKSSEGKQEHFFEVVLNFLDTILLIEISLNLHIYKTQQNWTY